MKSLDNFDELFNSSKYIDVVIARYQEDISWIQRLDNPHLKIKVYNKFHNEENFLPNVGREGHTYLYHIVNNYDNLNEYTYFLQADPSYHCHEIIHIMNNMLPNKSIEFFGAYGNEGIFSGCVPVHPNGLPMYYFFDLLFNMTLKHSDIISFYGGAQFVVSRETIRLRPKNFYKFLLKFLSYDINPIEGYIIERLWPYIFDVNINLSKKYELFL